MILSAVKKIYYKPPEQSRTFTADIIKVCVSSLISQSLIHVFYGQLSRALVFHIQFQG